ncbi:hypothetical protein FKW77_004935 [Venturia effusa]|uniref:Uncharacterized protein n=1 Tax=Venturia effusa TaxID=50376 RepID=A0A517KZE8_9PEZI|nr:hypothetical protein FKW77_004935 [Venturia effusa]
MANSLSYKTITPDRFATYLARYEDVVPDNLRDLDAYRFVTVPGLLEERRSEGGEAWLEKEEVQKLVDWKLKHGTFRPSLAKLVASNTEELIVSTTKNAFNSTKQSTQDMVKQLAKNLKGIGPATAALLASCYDPENIPFFSDELFRWTHWDGILMNTNDTTSPLKKPGKGWSRQIGYTPKEWESMGAKCKLLRRRMSAASRPVTCLDIEKVAYVPGTEDVDIEDDLGDVSAEGDKHKDEGGSDDEEPPQGIKDNTKRIKQQSKPTSLAGKKRKGDVQQPSEPTTKRTRSKRLG